MKSGQRCPLSWSRTRRSAFRSAGLLASLLAAAPARGQATLRDAVQVTEEHAEIHQALLLNPIGPIVGLALTANDAIEKVYSLNLRYHHELGRHVALTVAPVFTHAEILSVSTQSLGLKVGPRLSTADPGLEGWYVLPLALAGGVWSWQGEHSLTSAFLWGGGLEAGHTWNWGGFVLETGLGVQYSGYAAHRSFDESSIPGPSLKPMINGSVGYGW